MNRLTATPLPECLLCGMPTRRRVAERTGGFCSDCSDGIAETVRMLPVRLPPAPDDVTTYVERYRPPVPPPLRLVTEPASEQAEDES